jgi:peptidoglycan/xylan/chitin deacetylase (PgdA/CDA1 family)
MTVALCYHHVTPTGGPLSNTPQRLHDHLLALRRAGYAFIGLDELAGDPAPRRRRRKTVLVTFDDGYVDNWFWAYPVLRDLRIPSVFFVITGVLHEGPPRQPPETTAEVRRLSDDANADRFLRWSELDAMQSDGLVSVQSHTHSHLDLRGFGADRAAMLEALRGDLSAASDAIETRLRSRPHALAWPWGYSTPEARREAEAIGLVLQFSVVPGRIGTPADGRPLSRLGADDTGTEALVRHAQLLTMPLLGAAYTLARQGYNALRNYRGELQ